MIFRPRAHRARPTSTVNGEPVKKSINSKPNRRRHSRERGRSSIDMAMSFELRPLLLSYWLPGHEPLLWPGNNASEEEKQAWRERWAGHKRGLGDGWGCM
jgi:hypothetical protein